MSTIAVIALLIFAGIGVASVIIYLFGESDKRKETEKEDVFVFPGNCEFTSKPCDTPYENLWNEVVHPMRRSSFIALVTAKDDGSIQYKERKEKIYKDEILHLMREGILYDRDKTDSSVREFCLGQTPLNQSVEYRIKTAEIMRKYITTGKIPNKEE